MSTGDRWIGKRIRLEELRKTFPARGGREVAAVDNLTLEVQSGELLTLLGPSGCGKTTVLRLISGLESPTHGQVFIGERLVNDLAPYRRNVGLVFQSYALFPHLNVFENVAYALRIRKVRASEVRERVSRTLNLVRLDGYEARLPAQLSGGEQQRVALARALVLRPDVLLLDEPLSNLDAKLRVNVRGEIRQIQRTLGITAIYVTHDQSEAMGLSDRIAVMGGGQVLQVGLPQDIYLRPASEFVADFIGRASLLPGRVRSCTADAAIVEFLNREVEVRSWSGTVEQGQPVLVVVRPEALRIVSMQGDVLRAVVRRLDYQGAVAECHLEVNGHLLRAVIDLTEEGPIAKESAVVGLQFRSRHLHVIGLASRAKPPRTVASAPPGVS